MSWPLLIFVMVGQFLALWRTKNTGSQPANSCLNFFQHALRYQFETWYMHLVCSATHQVRVSSQSGHPDLLYSQEWVKVIFLHLWPQKLYRTFRFGTLWPTSCSYPRHSQLKRHSLMLANELISQFLTALVIMCIYWYQLPISTCI